MPQPDQELFDKFEILAAASMDGYWAVNRTGTIVFATHVIGSIYGYTPEELVGMHLREFEAKENDAEMQAHIATIIATGYDRFETIHRRKDGSCIDVEVSTVFSQSDDIFYAFTRNISERKQIEEQLKKSEEKFRSITALSPDIISIITEEGYLAYNSPAALQIHGYTEAEMQGRNTFELIHPEDQHQVNEAFATLLANPDCSVVTQYRYLHKDGSYTWMEATARNHLNNPLLNGVVAISRNITPRKELEKQRLEMERNLMHMQKLESLGLLAGGIAHDFNNILTGIIGNISFARSFIDESHKATPILRQAEKATKRASDLANQLLTFAKGGELIKKVVSVRQILEETVPFVLRGSNVSYRIEMSDEELTVAVDEGQLIQAINNIVINASQAMPGGGTITICVDTIACYNPGPSPTNDENYVRLRFTDCGCGISEENLQRIFDPYFTTKVGGSGLGLATSYAIVSKHGGWISAASTVGSGSTFMVLLPKNDTPLPSCENTESTSAKASRDGASIVVMDDEEIIRDLTHDLLTDLGYQVRTCSDGSELVELYRAALTDGSPYAAVIMDLTIPGGIGGKEAAAQLLALDPAARLIVSSGYSTDPIMSDFASFGFSAVLKKPYDAESLFQVITTVLSREPYT